ncbi:unnamed protein product, partial [Iphiclides podalirius]
MDTRRDTRYASEFRGSVAKPPARGVGQFNKRPQHLFFDVRDEISAINAADLNAAVLRAEVGSAACSGLINADPNGLVDIIPAPCARGCGFDPHYWKDVV